MTAGEHQKQPIFLVGASVRAAAFSALRLGWEPWCVDLFADEDLRIRCPAMELPGPYPDGFLPWVANDMPGPFLFTGALENWPFLVEKMAKHRPLWGNKLESVLASRNPSYLHQSLTQRGLPALLALWDRPPAQPPGGGRWLFKPIRSAGGTNVQFLDEMSGVPREFVKQCYFQEYREGTPCSAIYSARDGKATFLGLTRQFIGTDWLGVDGFRYAGNIGPLEPEPNLYHTLTRIGHTLTEACGLQGLFGVDGIVTDHLFWPVEINPRYTSSIEVIECATGTNLLAHHRLAFDPPAPVPEPIERPTRVVAKGILFARETIVFPDEGPWLADLDPSRPIDTMPGFADVPPAGEELERDRPIFTVFAEGPNEEECERTLRERVAEVEAMLYG